MCADPIALHDPTQIKLWNTHSGFCFVTFKEHTAPVTGLAFIGGSTGSNHVVVSSSLDGTVRAFDLIRYRNFRTMTTPTPVQFLCVAADPSGEWSSARAGEWAVPLRASLVAAGGRCHDHCADVSLMAAAVGR